MAKVSTHILLPHRIAEAEALWYDTSRRPAWVDGFHHVVRERRDWPRAGGELVWDSTPGGRGRVVERVTSYEQRVGQTSVIEELRLAGTQTVSFTAVGTDQVEVALALEYTIQQPSGPVGALVDLFFVRRLMGESLRRTLARFARELHSDHVPL